MSDEEKSPKKLALPKKLLKKFFPFLLIISLIVGATVFVIRQKPEVLGLSKTQSESLEEVNTLLEEVGKLMTLPTDEKPTIATVSDAEKVKTQSFFKLAQNGDKVLIFANTKKAILYRPSEKKIVEVGTVNLNQQTGQTDREKSGTPSASGEDQTSPTFKVVVYNGTTTAGVSQPIEQELKSKIKEVSVIQRAVANKTDYDKTQVIDLSGQREEDTQRIAQALNAVKINLPDGEKKPADADFLIIVGSDRIPAQE